MAALLALFRRSLAKRLGSVGGTDLGSCFWRMPVTGPAGLNVGNLTGWKFAAKSEAFERCRLLHAGFKTSLPPRSLQRPYFVGFGRNDLKGASGPKLCLLLFCESPAREGGDDFRATFIRPLASDRSGSNFGFRLRSVAKTKSASCDMANVVSARATTLESIKRPLLVEKRVFMSAHEQYRELKNNLAIFVPSGLKSRVAMRSKAKKPAMNLPAQREIIGRADVPLSVSGISNAIDAAGQHAVLADEKRTSIVQADS